MSTDNDAQDHIHKVFVADFRHLARFIADHPGEDAAIEELIEQLAAYRAESFVSCMGECFELGGAVCQASIETQIVEFLGETQ